MKYVKTLVASAALAASLGAQAQVTGSLGGGAGSFLLLSSPALCTLATPCSLTGSVNASIVGGTILNSDQPFADIPKGSIAGGNFLSAGPTTTQPSVVTFSTGIDYISFLWGSPDLYNGLTITTMAGDNFAFSAAGLGFSVTNGDQSFSQYVQFAASAGTLIKSLTFTNVPATDAFEVANFTVTPVPEPETYALMLAGFAELGFVARRRRQS